VVVGRRCLQAGERLAQLRGLVLLGAELHPNAKTLKDAGVMRIALGAGQYDHVAHGSLMAEAMRLSNEGIETRFFDLGRVGHTYAVEDTSILNDAIAFAGGAETDYGVGPSGVDAGTSVTCTSA
jgi:predicted esterase